MLKVLYTIIVVLVMLFIITFSEQNTGQVSLKYLEYETRTPVYMLIFIVFLAGVIFTGFMGIVERFRLNRTITRLNKTVRELRRDLRATEPPPVIEDQPRTTSQP